MRPPVAAFRPLPVARQWLAAALAVALVAGAALAAHAAWLPLKARLAQALLEEAWERARAGEPQPRPWPWADTWPVARLTLPVGTGPVGAGSVGAGSVGAGPVGPGPVRGPLAGTAAARPPAGRGLVVLAGASGRTLAFGPGHLDGSARPGEAGNVVIAGHRDTHFRALRELSPGDELELEDAAGAHRRYRVAGTAVVRYDDTSVLAPAADRLTLVTCWPFDALHPGGPLRYVVVADAATSPAG